LFRHTTALTMVELNDLDVRDDALEALAAASRNRMERIGLGIPEAWIQHEQGALKHMGNQQKDAKQSAALVLPERRKLYSGVRVPGGLQVLSLKNCAEVTNRGIRTIVRSCPMLWRLNLHDCKCVSMQVFRGPWVCNRLQDLDISGINMRPLIRTKSMQLEEQIEGERFPLTRLLKTHPSDDFRDDGFYDYMVSPLTVGPRIEPCDSDLVDEDGLVQEDEETPMDPRKSMYPAKVYRNDGETRRTLNEVYRKLGQFDQLIYLNMENSDYRIRLQDGLDLVLPALTKNLRHWNICRRFIGHTLQDVELEWFGKHFGYGFDFTKDDGELDRQLCIQDEYQGSSDEDSEDDDEAWKEFYDECKRASGKDLNRVSKLEVLQVTEDSISQGNLDEDLYEWFIESGFHVDQVA
ncbi:hypothetical protein BGZ98_000416, partial [Dissophora globulifera]